jgi:hypothetical protein
MSPVTDVSTFTIVGHSSDRPFADLGALQALIAMLIAWQPFGAWLR